MLLQQNETVTLEAFALTYKDFMSRMVQICTNATGDIPASFTLNYTYVELLALKEDFNANRTKKKCGCRTISVQNHFIG